MSTFATRLTLVPALLMAVTACHEAREGFRPQPDPAIGTTEFVSAAGPVGSDYRGTPTDVPAEDSDQGGGTRTIEEGDIYRVLAPGRVLNLNAYRGLQIIDVSDPRAPSVIGGLRIAGSPVELYAVGERAVVLMNDWYGYWGSRSSYEVGREQGGAVLLVDLSDPTRPTVLDRAVVPGYLITSRLARGDSDALYVAASLWQMSDGGGTVVAVGSGERTIVASFTVGDRTLTPKGELDLGGSVSDIQATPEALLVARTEWSSERGEPASRVALVDISAPDGAMTLGPDIAVAGQVKNQFNLDLRGDVLRVVSEGFWTEGAINHLETFAVSDPDAPRAVDHDQFGAGESLYATLFVGADKAFFVTYLRQDPFHAFHIAPDGQADERTAFVVSGWNDFFRATFADTRLIGVGTDDAAGARTLALSLYDITDLDNPRPLVARANVALEGAWSEASWDHRAFTVLEDAVSVPSATDAKVLETGLVLLPYQGWNEDGYASGVQLFTFSAGTLTARGTLAHETPVRRAFMPADDIAACLSDVSLALHDVSDPDAPDALGAVELAPNYPEIEIYGAHGLRHRETAGWDWWGTHTPAPGRAEVISLTADPDRAPALAGFDVAPGASLTRVGDLAVAMHASWQIAEDDPKGGAWQTTIDVWDLSQPTAPRHTGTLVTRALPPYWSGWGYGTPRPAVDYDCYDCGGGYGMSPRGTAVGDAIAFLEGVYESAPAGTQRYCVTTPPGTYTDPDRPDSGSGSGSGGGPIDPDARSSASQAEGAPVYYTGRIECVTRDDGPESCYGNIYACTGLEVECVIVEDPAAIGAKTECRDEAVMRYWTRWLVHVLDLSTPSAPEVADPIALPLSEEGVAVLGVGKTLWVATREPVEVEDDGRSYVRYFARAIDLARPSDPGVGPRVNVPGVLLAVSGDDLYTLDYVYDDDHVESAISRATLEGEVARLAARHRIDDRQVEVVLLDGAGHVLVSHGPVYWWYGYAVDAGGASTTGTSQSAQAWETRLTVLEDQDLDELATMPVDTWASLRWAGAGRALFQVPGGLLVVNVATPSAPRPQAFFSTAGWPEEIAVAQGTIYFAGGRYGLYAFDLDAFNLLPE